MMSQVFDGHGTASRFFTATNASSYDTVVRIATFGQDYLWKRQILNIINDQHPSCLSDPSSPPSSSHCPDTLPAQTHLDLASGTGILSSLIERSGKHVGERPRSVVGLDLTYDYLRTANKKCSTGQLTNGTAELLPYREQSFDSVTSSYLAKYVDTERVVKECWRVLKHGGVVVFHDFTYPSNTLARSLWNSYFKILRTAAKTVTSWAPVFQELDQVVRMSNWLEQTMKALEGNGFKDISFRFYTMRTSAIVSANKP
ncbi:MAG TPA: class I SAM-dependent methyltransferase [Candidatus Nitrosopolaris sp.]|nr:class I SAM-dependent methyltransferase [Candidatus Nitrosopolaris sp.]